jgi:transitional endoplasmic reticulum ATPase
MEGGASGFSGTQPILSQLLTEMDGVQQMQGVMVIAATNRVDIIDTALLRPGRFDKIVYVPNPDKNTRFRILEVHTKGKPISRDIDLMKIAEMTNGFSGAEVSAVVNTAISLVLHEYLQKYPSPEEAAKHTSDAVVSSQYFEEAVRKIKKQRETKPGETISSMVSYR